MKTEPDIRNNVNEVKKVSMSDELIKFYLPNAKIIIYNNLKDYNTIEEILPENKSFAVLLYVSANLITEVSGHWTCITRLNNEISYFDSYGKTPDYAIDHWFKKNTEQQTKYLSQFLNKTKLKVFYNGIQYQSTPGDISTCGRHCIFYILNMQKDKDLHDYYILMKNIKEKTNMTYDKIVSYMINNID